MTKDISTVDLSLVASRAQGIDAQDLLCFLLRAARHPADFDGRPTAGAQVLASVSMIPWYPCH